MWLFPGIAAAVALAFAVSLTRRVIASPRSYLVFWALALAMYSVASLMVALGALDGWTTAEFRVYWAVGAVLNVPFLAQGEVDLLVRNRAVRSILYVALVFVTAYTIAVVRTAAVDAAALGAELPSGKEVFGDGTTAHRLPQLVAIPAYLLLVAGALWTVWRMRGRPELRGRLRGTLLIVLGATVIAAFGSAFAALGLLVPFSIALLVGVAVMFWGFLHASRRSARARSAATT